MGESEVEIDGQTVDLLTDIITEEPPYTNMVLNQFIIDSVF